MLESQKDNCIIYDEKVEDESESESESESGDGREESEVSHVNV
jgi:hypothetical protein